MFNECVNKFNNSNDKLIAFLASLCLFLSAVEFVIPKPLPFMRLGLANVPIILSLYLLKPKQIFFLMLLKVIGQGFISGTVFSYIFLFSLVGTFTSGCTMLIAHRTGKHYIGPVGICLLGSLANAASQIVLSDWVLFGESAQYIAPILIINASITGLALGIITAKFIDTSKWFFSITSGGVTGNIAYE